MRLFLPRPRAIAILAVIGLGALGGALYMRYFGIENSTVGFACDGGLNSLFCKLRRTTIGLFEHSAFGIAALAAAVVNFWRPSVLMWAIALLTAGFGLVLYNIVLAALAVALLVLSLARPAFASE